MPFTKQEPSVYQRPLEELDMTLALVPRRSGGWTVMMHTGEYNTTRASPATLVQFPAESTLILGAPGGAELEYSVGGQSQLRVAATEVATIYIPGIPRPGLLPFQYEITIMARATWVNPKKPIRYKRVV